MNEYSAEKATNPETEVFNAFWKALKNDEEPLLYGEIMIIVRDYIVMELDLDIFNAERIVTWMLESGKFPDEDDFMHDYDDAMQKLRLVIFTEMVELYYITHDYEDISIWYENIVEFATENHEDEGETDFCLDQGDVESGECTLGICPYKVIYGLMRDSLCTPRLDTFEYDAIPDEMAALAIMCAKVLAREDILIFNLGEEDKFIDAYKRKLIENDIQFDNSVFQRFATPTEQ